MGSPLNSNVPEGRSAHFASTISISKKWSVKKSANFDNQKSKTVGHHLWMIP